jgi:hypothetical protein
VEAASEIVEVLGYGSDPKTGVPTRRVRLTDGSVITQAGKITEVVTEITRADGTVEPGATITDIKVRSIP